MTHKPDTRSSLRHVPAILRRDERGAILPMAAPAILVLLAMLGSGFDLGRAYMAKSRLQQACDAGVMSGRAEFSSKAWEEGAHAAADAIFAENFQNGVYGSTDLAHAFTADSETKRVNGTASASVPTSIMRIFGFSTLPVSASCGAETQMPNVDIMFVLDTTKSMTLINSGDSQNRMAVMREAVRNFYNSIESSKVAEAQTRYGFVPFASNVNVGHLLKPEWLADKWSYPSRRGVRFDVGVALQPDDSPYYTKYVSGNENSTVKRTPLLPEQPCVAPATTDYKTTTIIPDHVTETYYDESTGTYNVLYHHKKSATGTAYWTEIKDGICYIVEVYRKDYIDEVFMTRKYYNYVEGRGAPVWHYGPVEYPVTPLKANVTADGYLAGTGTIVAPIATNFYDRTVAWNGCIEERQTVSTPIDASTGIPAGAYDLNIDLVPNSDATKWGPSLPHLIYARYDTTAWHPPYNTHDIVNKNMGDLNSGEFATCPSQARRLATINEATLQSYLNNLQPNGFGTYPDIGMIWGARLLSPDGLFAAENNISSNGGPIARHLILMTDGDTEVNVNFYGAYGYEALERRRLPDRVPTADEIKATVNGRFQAICAAAKTKFTVWVIAFGTELKDHLLNCATSSDTAFQANNAAELNERFRNIAGRIANLRITR